MVACRMARARSVSGGGRACQTRGAGWPASATVRYRPRMDINNPPAGGPAIGQPAPNPYNPPAAMPGMGRAGPSGAEYEFNESENSLIGDLAGTMRFVGTVSVVLGVLMCLGGMATCMAGSSRTAGTGFGYLVQGLVVGIIGAWTRGAAAAFDRVVTTEGNDIANTMTALAELKRIYTLQKWLLIIALVLIALAFVLGALFFARATSSTAPM